MVAYRGAASTNSGNSNVASLDLTLSTASAAAGDVAFLVAGWNQNSGTLTGPSGWTAEAQQNISTTLTSGCWRKVLDAGDISTDTITVSSGGAGRCSAALIVVSDPGTVQTAATDSGGSNTTSQPFAGITPTTTSLVVELTALNSATTAASAICTAPGGWTERADTLSGNSSGREVGAFTMSYNTIGSSAVSGGTIATSVNAHSASWTWAINEAGAGGAPNEGTASGSISWVGAATGARASQGTATGSVSFAGSATGARASQGSASGSVSWVGTATGSQPGLAPNEGTASGTITWVGVATGATTHQGAASGAILWAGSATGEAPVTIPSGTAAGAIHWTGVATGSKPLAYFFEPPTHEEPIRTKYPPLSYFRMTYAASVLKVNGAFTSIRTPDPSLLTTVTEGTDYFRGGYIYNVTAAVAAELAAAGYSVTEE